MDRRALALMLSFPASLVAAPVLAAPVAEVSGSYAYTLDLPEGVDAFDNPPFVVLVPEDPQPTGDGELAARNVQEGSFTTSLNPELLGPFEPLDPFIGGVEGLARADTRGAASLELSLLLLDVVVTNGTDEDVLVPLTVDYELAASALVDDPATEAASAAISLFVNPTDFDFEPFVETLGFDASGPGSDILAGSFETDLLLNPGTQVLSIDLTAAVSAQAAPIPVPATLPLLAAALGGLALGRRRGLRLGGGKE